MTSVYGTVQQSSASVTGEGHGRQLRVNRRGGLFTASMFEDYILAGQGYRVTIGALSAGADVTGIVGGGNGTTIDSDQPELVIGVPTGTSIIPLRVSLAVQGDLDADAEILNSVLFVDMAKGFDGTGTFTAETVRSLLGGGTTPTSNCTVGSAFTADTTDPVMSELLAYRHVRASDNGTAASAMDVQQLLEYDGTKEPFVIHGPAMLILCWGGTAAVTGLASASWVEAPTTNFS